ncbi:HSP20-like chaperone [Neocallimastix californiae]|uniref:HSP20-like chaperone n=1 Tax=Neocallimastix californiae TaxID=1754190 RepID=A0A1Y2EQZ9_9FUNG|nr:HSP20-like chaperone [Neocallimastix californiae]|eukprot:ORY74011.1 HSP20-like chaperone [Neocallimastix californiae]
MSLFIREHPLSIRRNNSLLRNSLFDDFDSAFDNEFFNHPLITFPTLYPYPYLSYNPVKSLENQISKTFNSDVFKSVDFSPKINLSEDENNYYIHADLPGMRKDQVKIELSDEDRVLTISETKKEEQKDTKEEENNKKYSRIECSYGKFSRSFSIPENADINNIQAKMENGVLEVTLKKMEPQMNEHKHSIQIQ